MNDVVLNEEIVKEVKSLMPTESLVCDIAELFKVFGDSTRTKILSCLEIRQLCVGDIASCLDMTKSAISHQLRILRSAHLIKSKKVGKEVYYSLDDEHVSKIFECAKEHLLED